MAATYIQPTLSDFEAVFSPVINKATGERMFQLVRPDGSEAYYLGKLRETDAGSLCVKVLTSVASGHRGARGCGEDAIRAVLYWIDAEGWQKGLGKERRVNRAGGAGKTARDIVERALERARDVVRMRGSLPACPKCGRPMVLRTSRDGSKVFYGCIGWKPNNAGCNGSRWDVPQEQIDRTKAERQGKSRRNNTNPHVGTQAGAAGQTENGLMDRIVSLYGELSPECLSGDGEIPYREYHKREKQLRRELEAAFTALGQRVTERQAMAWYKGEWSPAPREDRCSCGETATYTVKGERMCDECREGYIDGMIADRYDPQR